MTEMYETREEALAGRALHYRRATGEPHWYELEGGLVEPWMIEYRRDARKYIAGVFRLSGAFRWEYSKQGHEYWKERARKTFSELSPEDQAYIRLIAGADGQPVPEVG